MKKTLATLLVVALVASLCGVMFVSAEATNLVAGKTYEISEQYRMGGEEVGWGYSETAPVSYPDDGNELTDGVLPAEPSYADAAWMALHKNTPAQTERGYGYIRFDLGAVCDLDELKLTTMKQTSAGITCPYIVDVYVSNDGTNYEQAGNYTIETVDLDALADDSAHVITVALDASAQYVEMRVTSYGWCFMGEVEVMGTAPAGSDEPVEPEAPAEPEMFWLTHYNDGFVEGSGVIFTEEDTAGGWWLHVAFAPIAGAENAYEIVEITNGLADGSATTVAVPEGGFVWASNYGNDYISLGMGDTDFTSPNCTDAINRATAWQVGDQFVISGVDFETIPTTTSGVNWYDDAYVCTATIAPYVPGSAPDAPITGDAGILVFAVLAVVAIAGCAVASKIKSSAL